MTGSGLGSGSVCFILPTNFFCTLLSFFKRRNGNVLSTVAGNKRSPDRRLSKVVPSKTKKVEVWKREAVPIKTLVFLRSAAHR
jgi:hypothetical protein